MKITFWGASRQVTGSMFLLTLDDGYQILIDCGIDMGNLSESMPLYPGACFPFDPTLVNVVLLTHAHLDHSGKLPNLYREGYEGQILCTSPTAALTEILLQDSANLNRDKLRRYYRQRDKGYKDNRTGIEPGNLYTEQHVKETIEQFVPIQFHRRFPITSQVHLTFLPAGHLLGAAYILLEVEEGGTTKRLLFSGDIGRQNYPLLLDPEPAPEADYVFCETTYGSREHMSILSGIEELEQVIRKACVEKPGRLIIPAFSIGRTQAVLYTLHKLYADNKLPPIKIFADSPMAHKSDQVYERCVSFLNEEAQQFRKEYGSLFNFDTLAYIEHLKDSKLIDNHHEPCIIISSSGMLEGGRIQHHIRANIENPYCTILMVGYTAEGTMGERLINANGTLRIGRKELPVRAEVITTDSFSGHGDVHDLLRFVQAQDPAKVKAVFLVHGEESAMADFKTRLEGLGYARVEMPRKGETYEL